MSQNFKKLTTLVWFSARGKDFFPFHFSRSSTNHLRCLTPTVLPELFFWLSCWKTPRITSSTRVRSWNSTTLCWSFATLQVRSMVKSRSLAGLGVWELQWCCGLIVSLRFIEEKASAMEYWSSKLGNNRTRSLWRRSCATGISSFERQRISDLQLKRERRKVGVDITSQSHIYCTICGRGCAAAIGLYSHMRTDKRWLLIRQLGGRFQQ